MLFSLYVLSALAGGVTCDKSKAKNDSKNCCTEQVKADKAKSDQCTDSNVKTSNKMDCCKKELKSSKASKSNRDVNNEVVKLTKDSK